jgi:hypothetical protein
MFTSTSRYYMIAQGTYQLPDGRLAAYVRRRFLPPTASLQAIAQVTVLPAERIDVFAARTLGDAEHFWLIADANDAMDPETLLIAGQPLTVPMPTPTGPPPPTPVATP